MKTELTMEESLNREKGMIFPQDFSEKTLLSVAHSRNCIEALEKQIVKQPHTCGSYCPTCGTIVLVTENPLKKYCEFCGQRLFD